MVSDIAIPVELPPGLEEEPGADSDDDEIFSSTVSAITKKETKKTTTVTSGRRNLKDQEKIDGSGPDDEEARLEKELAEIYKDSDYPDITEKKFGDKETASTIISTLEDEEKPIGRAKNGFKFAPDSTSKAEIEKFRTSIDEISCKNRQKLSVTQPNKNDPVLLKNVNSSYKFEVPMIISHLGLVLFTAMCI
ncbi:unnamed protein product [Arctia plantaginis]|uniref:Uncharacterized protein n=1 Tax=Arctia plantaginis TaxID=874455 RepID=A0A8S1AQ39_ARCPL|nr:unnamed protein product [Arctia plantaginis]CAB3252219.1 unnamed protein product [Arctia plantaginis]